MSMRRALSVSCLLTVLSFNLPAQTSLAPLPALKHSFIVIAHRGDHISMPENTLEAFREAIRNEVDFIEVDLRTTADSVLVVIHDATVDRTTNGSGKVQEQTYASLPQLTVSDKNHPTTGRHHIPTFEEVLKLAKDRIHIYLDFKNASVQQSYKLIQRYEMEHQVIVYINTPEQFSEWRKLAPAIPLMISLPDGIRTAAALTAFLQRTPVELLDGAFSDYTPDMVQAAVQAGVQVWPDIQSKEEANNWYKALAIGVSGLQTDHPADLIAWLKKKQLR